MHKSKLLVQHLCGMTTHVLHQSLLQLQGSLIRKWQNISKARYKSRFQLPIVACFIDSLKFVVSNLIDLNFEFVVQISSYFTGKILGIIRDSIHHMKRIIRSESDKQNSNEILQPAGTIQKVDAALEFIKHICAIFSLDQSVQHDVLVILIYSVKPSNNLNQVMKKMPLNCRTITFSR